MTLCLFVTAPKTGFAFYFSLVEQINYFIKRYNIGLVGTAATEEHVGLYTTAG